MLRLFRGTVAFVVTIMLPTVLPGQTPIAEEDAPPVYEFRNGHWFDGQAFVERTMYSRYGILLEAPPAPLDSVIDLMGGWVIPPYAEAHNHNVEASSKLAELIERYLAHGVFYVKNPNVRPASVVSIRHLVNQVTSIDVSFAYGGFTGSGGHPIGVVQRNLDRGLWPEAAGDGAFFYPVEDLDDIRTAWPSLLAHQPDFVKTYLLYSEEYEERSTDSAYIGHRGLDPELLPEIVSLAHGAGLRVTTHVETAADFRHALDAGVDEINHLPGFRGNERNEFPRPDIFLLDDEDGRRAHDQGTTVVTTLGNFEGAASDSVAEQANAVFRHNLELLRRHRVALALGSDGYGSVGVAEATQIRDLGIFSDLELLKAWVETTPRTIFPHRKIGRLEAGYEASFLVLRGNPLEDFASTQDIALRVKRGLLLAPPRN